jgi:uncharacterized SAM-binding protein YcdF (DUF218 family)
MRRIRWVFLLLLIGAVLATRAGSFLLVSNAEKSDVIVVLAGEASVRPARALELLRQNMAPRAVFDAETGEQVYDQPLTAIAQNFLNRQPEANRTGVCAITSRSTFAETSDVERCIAPLAPHSVLLVTSGYHTRRALTIFSHSLPQYHWTVSDADSPGQFGPAWWTHREWAKATFDEWSKLVWWEVVDRWRQPAASH